MYRSMDYIRKGLSEETIQEDDPMATAGSVVPSPINFNQSSNTPDTDQQVKERQQSLSSPATAERQKKKQRRKRRSGNLSSLNVPQPGTSSRTAEECQQLQQQELLLLPGDQTTTTTDDSSETHSERSSTNYSVIYNPSTPTAGGQVSASEDGEPAEAESWSGSARGADGDVESRRQRLIRGNCVSRNAFDASFEWSFGDNAAGQPRDEDDDARSSR